jgi:uncharacterized phage-associated protein
MIINHDREKLVNAILFFSSNTEKCGITKLYKLLYFLDFEHYKQIGRNVTGLKYYAMEKGPFPSKLDKEIRRGGKSDLNENVSFGDIKLDTDRSFKKVESKNEPDLDVFTKREMQIMQQLAEEFNAKDAEEMVDATHLENLPWDSVFFTSPRGTVIPYELAVAEEDKEFISYLNNQNQEILNNYR